MLKIKKNNLNVRQLSVRKKTAARICAVQVLYSSMIGNISIQEAINNFQSFYQEYILNELNIKKIDLDLFNEILFNVEKNKKLIDKFISENLAQNWAFDRLSLTELSIFRLSVYELCISLKFDKKTIINEYVSMFGVFSSNVSFANGFLDNISKKEILN